ncbi:MULTISPECIES: hypothetical protein [Carnobacterium]|uniref:hypothetical protein n=1 Tax=Carnobacterium TaxID=2747 RepID=UPI00191BB460|nr:hypothetical protein [Carnobacterium maltaromaticum]CAD5897850.1 hypothetical protein CMALT430_170196 [Carnobacterium maltaromaticum]
MDEKERQLALLRAEIQEKLIKTQEKANESLEKIHQSILDIQKIAEQLVNQQQETKKQGSHLRLVPNRSIDKKE